MFDVLKNKGAIIIASVSLIVSACTSVGITPLPNPYSGTDTVVEKTLATVKSFGAAQETIITVCGPAQPETVEAQICSQIIPVEQTLRPAVRATARVGAEYLDVDARIKEVGPQAPAEWLMLAAELAGRMADAYDPIRADVDTFIANAGELTN